ncbi:hypothetical protein BDP55DRAFT_687052 [Colletotrichum godetiae]|uniref:Chromo domain-containing protein n=1 Tax=Colletotrichum godetiae TaxID=1209918 RepID=A0AAJ0A8M1_9PEZI|nr:uncharacterized protein BDP55DRAFT_687052 [Colletotrichum godetiae]KAK1657056.1 hypothetical protein BDP55DRAFT_687052 [Colletotrichum godetiae]
MSSLTRAVVIETPGDQTDDISSPPTEAARSKHVVGADSEDASINAHDLLIFDKIVGHRRDPQTQMISHMRVRWRNGALTWEPEASIQKCAGQHLLSYWDCVNGTREGAMAESSRRIPEIEKHMTTTASIVTLDLCWIASLERPREPGRDVPYSERATLGSSAVGEGGRERATIPVVRRSKRHSRQSLNAIAGPDTVATAQMNTVGPARRQVRKRDSHGQRRVDRIADKLAPAVVRSNRRISTTELMAHKSRRPADDATKPSSKRARLF